MNVIHWGFLLGLGNHNFKTVAFFCFAILFLLGSAFAWWDNSWGYRQKITINSSQVPSDQVDFPVLVDINVSSNKVFLRALSDGNDVAFIASDDLTQLSHELEHFDSDGNLTAWVKIPSLSSSSDTLIYMYYGNSSASSQEDAFNAWDSNYVSILHMNETGSGKTVFCLNALYNACKQGYRALYMSFEEPEDRLVSHMQNFGFDVQPFIDKGTLIIKRFSALDIARSVEALLSDAKNELLVDVQPILIPEEFKADIVVMDSLSSIASAFSGEEYRFRILHGAAFSLS